MKTLFVLLIVCALLVLALGYLIETSPDGYEDETGFHFGKKG